MASSDSVFTTPPGAPFLESLVDALLDGRLIAGFAPRRDPLALASATLYLPTRRSIRQLRGVFLDRLGGEAAILPRLMALGEIDEDEAAFDVAADGLDLPEAIGPLERRLGLTKLILGWSRAIKLALLPLPGEDEQILIPSSPGDAAGLARDLAHFIDGMQVDRVPFAALARLTDEHAGRYDQHWDLTLRFLEIAAEQWPAFLAERDRIDPVDRRNRLIAADTARIAAGRLTGPVIVAGSTGSVPATRDLIAAIAASPLGAVVLPGLDQTLDDASWGAISEGEGAPGHPQAALKTLASALGIADRQAVPIIGSVNAARTARSRLVSEALRPAATTDRWRSRSRLGTEAADAAFAKVAIVEAAHEGEEALAIALALREALEIPGRRAALVTPDRGLASRVVAELARWDISVDDSAGRPLAVTAPGIFARLVLDAALENFAPVAILALLKHPFTTLGLARSEVRRATAALEIGALRGPQPPQGVAGLRTALHNGKASLGSRHAPRARRALGNGEWIAAADLVDRLDKAIGPLADLLRERSEHPALRFFAAHVEAIEASAQAYAGLYAQEAGESLRDFLTDLVGASEDALDLPASGYAGLFAALIGDRSVRGGEPKHPRLAIFGLLEARLLTIERLVLGGLDEGVWPAEARSDPWLNRPMRAALDLSLPEKRIGLSAHDFEQALGAEEVVISRALKRGRSPTVPSRWLQRLKACFSETYAAMVARGDHWRNLARRLDAPSGPVEPARAPRPRPPLALRPTALPVTQISALVRDPYSVHARQILELQPLDAIAVAPDAADRGTLIHDALQRFDALCAAGVPHDALARLMAIGDELFVHYADYPDVQAFWRPRFAVIASFLADWEAARRPGLARIATETSGRLAWPTQAGRTFTLTARADRIEAIADGTTSILDFKTGAVPTAKQVEAGLEPQLALETAMLAQAGFPGFEAVSAIGAPVIVKLSGGRKGCQPIALAFEHESAAEVAARSLRSLKALIDRFEDEQTPYASLLHPMFKTRRFGDYDHLARVREWSLAAEESEDE